MKKIFIALFTYFHSLTGTTTSGNGGLGISVCSLIFITMTTTILGSKPLTVPPVKVTNASISQLYSDQVTSISQRSCDEEMRASSTCLCALAVDKRDRVSVRLLLHCKGGGRRSAEVYEIYWLKVSTWNIHPWSQGLCRGWWFWQRGPSAGCCQARKRSPKLAGR